jgi:hypothetical protein
MGSGFVKDRRAFEIMLIVVVLATTVLLTRMGVHRTVVLNLFYLPIVLTGYYLGRYSAGTLAFFAILCVTIATALDSTGLAATYASPVMIGLVLTVWAAVLGLTALLTGTLCDERAATVKELHEAYVGVVEVVSKYLQGSESKGIRRSTRVAEICERVAREMSLSPKQGDDIRVSVLLHDLTDVEVTTRVLKKAIRVLESETSGAKKSTFRGADLIHSLGSVLRDAAPLMLNQDDRIHDCLSGEGESGPVDIPLGAKIIRAVRAYDALITSGEPGQTKLTPIKALNRLRQDAHNPCDAAVLDAIERVACTSVPDPALEPAYG